MPWEPFHLTRKQIYDAVWSAPMRDAAKKFGISDVALGKICRKLGVPRPKQGYWLRRSVGQTPAEAPLPPTEAGQPTEHVGQRWRDPERSATHARGQGEGDRPGEPAREVIVEEPIEIPATLDHAHRLVRQTAAVHRRPSSHRYYGTDDSVRCLDLSVSAAALDRALRIMDGLLRAFEFKGMAVHVGNDAPPGEDRPPRPGWLPRDATHVKVDGVWLGLQVFEHKTVRKALPEPQGWMKGTRLKEFLASRRPQRVAVSNGLLAIRLTHRWAYGWESLCKDGSRDKIEDRLGRLLPDLRAAAERVKRADAEHAASEKAAREAEQRRWEEEKRRREEEERVAKLRGTLAEWREAHDVRAFIAEARAIAAAGDQEIVEGSRLDTFLRWASAHADRIDPLRDLRREVRERVNSRSASERPSGTATGDAPA